MPQPIFCSRDTRYKEPFGALPAGDDLRLSLLLPDSQEHPVLSARLRLTRDGEDQPQLVEMAPGECQADHRWWRCSVAPTEGLYWYDFVFTDATGTYPVTRFDGGNGGLSADGGQWQLTVYDRDFQTPAWLPGGVMYQIFPDRFCKSTAAHIQPADRCVRLDWGGQPAFRMGVGGCTLGNDYFGGDLQGIRERLPYLQALGVNCLYLNPIFEAHSNHRYNTADYMAVDPGLGNEEDLRELCREAGERGIRIILDGVFSHTGDDSRYFNRKGRYINVGAYNSKQSPYYSWFKFQRWPDVYTSWWGIDTLPETVEEDPEFSNFITGDQGVLRHWMRQGVAGWRLDVADELPDGFLDRIRAAAKDEDPQALVLGEVWEDATNKISYGARRRFLRGRQLDSVMNYPFREGIIAFLTGGDAWRLMETVMELLENYPQPAVHTLMNHIGTHDTPRILTVLGGEAAAGRDREWQALQHMTSEQREKGLRFLRLAALLQFTLPGVPCIYYGDEMGMEGYGDPFNRGCFPWDNLPDGAMAPARGDTLPAQGHILDFYKALGRFRRQNPAFAAGRFIPVYAGTGHIAYIRDAGAPAPGNQVLIAVNRWCDPEPIDLPDPKWEKARVVAGTPPHKGRLMVPAEGFSVLVL